MRVTNGKNRSGVIIKLPVDAPDGWVMIHWNGRRKPTVHYRPFARRVAFAGGMTSALVRKGL